ncbi:AMP-binding protein [Pusillimonas sp. TS35]|uniref:class I adenylate-forming enzyme family protein n=1 Tax=Paracandidimonas lactea TaxID=2895524 RepID=UPI0013715ACB|nr:class I adenylate-forming enzyme family protein [Paracandidimonas lactea]MYN12423.1 AMP-binding protein [Pusillimonas sp. TS35]
MILASKDIIAQYTDKGWWGTETLGERFIRTANQLRDTFAVADPPNLASLTDIAPRRWSWAELLHKVGRYVAFFQEQGVRPDEVVVVQLPNMVDLHAIYLACAISRIIVSPVPMQYRYHELKHVFEVTHARCAITVTRLGNHRPLQELLSNAGKLESLEKVWYLGAEAGLHTEATNIEESISGLPSLDAAQLTQALAQSNVTANDVLTICWTSGTEAQPKGVPRSHNEWFIVGSSVIDAGQLSQGDQLLIPYPFVNMAGISTSLIAWLMIGGGLHHHHPFDVDVFVDQLRAENINYAVSAPAVLSMLLKDVEKLAGINFDVLTRIGSGGGPVSDWLVEQYHTRFGVEIVNYYGSNEGAALASTPQDIPDRRQRANFFPRYGVTDFNWSVGNSRRVSTRLVDLETGADITLANQVGELRFKGPTIFSGYYRAPELSANAFDDQGYYRTGDLFEIAGDDKQYYRFVGRSKDIVVRGGMNISSEEIENLLLGHPAIREAAIIGWPDERLGERVCAVVVPGNGVALSLPVLVDYLRNEEKIAAFKLPEKLIIADSLPRNLLGKVLKRELRQTYFGDGAAG